MRRIRRDEEGQAVVEFGLILLTVMMLTVGLIDVGRSIFLYNELSSVARFGSRWASVVGGTCAAPLGPSSADWCNQMGTSSGDFWYQAGNEPIQGFGTACPTYASTPSSWYTVSSFQNSNTTTIIGNLARRFDTDSNGVNSFVQLFDPTVSLSSLHACIQTTNASGIPSPGDGVTVQIYYPFAPAGKLLGTGTVSIYSDAHYVIE